MVSLTISLKSHRPLYPAVAKGHEIFEIIDGYWICERYLHDIWKTSKWYPSDEGKTNRQEGKLDLSWATRKIIHIWFIIKLSVGYWNKNLDEGKLGTLGISSFKLKIMNDRKLYQSGVLITSTAFFKWKQIRHSLQDEIDVPQVRGISVVGIGRYSPLRTHNKKRNLYMPVLYLTIWYPYQY